MAEDSLVHVLGQQASRTVLEQRAVDAEGVWAWQRRDRDLQQQHHGIGTDLLLLLLVLLLSTRNLGR